MQALPKVWSSFNLLELSETNVDEVERLMLYMLLTEEVLKKKIARGSWNGIFKALWNMSTKWIGKEDFYGTRQEKQS